jgi:hypothetical protein
MGAGGFGDGYGLTLCPICQQRVICYLYKYVNVIESFSPGTTVFDVTGNETVHFSADVLKPEPNTQKYEWFLNGKRIAEGVEEIDVTFGMCEDYELIFAVTDTNTLVRHDPKFDETYPKPYREVKWLINQADVSKYDFDIDVVTQNPDCTGESNGSVELMFSGGIAPWSVHSLGREIANPVTQLAAGTYEFAIVDGNGCGILKTIELIQDVLLEPRICTAGTWPDTDTAAGPRASLPPRSAHRRAPGPEPQRTQASRVRRCARPPRAGRSGFPAARPDR